MKSFRTLLRLVLTAAAAVGAYYLTAFILNITIGLTSGRLFLSIVVCSIVAVGLIMFFISPSIIRFLETICVGIVHHVDNLAFRELIGGIFGLILGLFIANLIGYPINSLSYGPYITIALSLFFGYIGFWVGRGKKEELALVFSRTKAAKEKKPKEPKGVSPSVLDTSVIIDGRIVDIYRTGFIESQLILPNFVLDELKRVADSPDPLKKSRGRRGMDILSELQKEFPQAIRVVDKDYEEVKEVDIKIIRLAVDMKAKIYTNDYNLNKMAQVQNVKVMNVNDLANAVKTVVLPGEEIVTRVLKEGKEQDQGVAYLEDGTMIVVEGGAAFVGFTLTIVVTSVLQTTAGRMIFAKPK